MKKEKKPHLFCGNNSFRCHHCGEELFFPKSSKPGYSLLIVGGLAKLIEKEHKHCKPSSAGKARFEYETPDEWFKSWDTGTSSLVLYAAMTGKAVLPDDPGPPRDPSDFGRCYRLLRLVDEPTRRSTLLKVMERHHKWQKIAGAWDELTELWEVESKNLDGKAPKLYKRMQELQ